MVFYDIKTHNNLFLNKIIDQVDLKDKITDGIMRQFNVVSGTPDECAVILQELIDAGLNLPLMEVVGKTPEQNLQTIRLLGERVLPNIKF